MADVQIEDDYVRALREIGISDINAYKDDQNNVYYGSEPRTNEFDVSTSTSVGTVSTPETIAPTADNKTAAPDPTETNKPTGEVSGDAPGGTGDPSVAGDEGNLGAGVDPNPTIGKALGRAANVATIGMATPITVMAQELGLFDKAKNLAKSVLGMDTDATGQQSPAESEAETGIDAAGMGGTTGGSAGSTGGGVGGADPGSSPGAGGVGPDGQPFAEGGPVPQAQTDTVPGPDDQKATLQSGEYVIPKHVVDWYGQKQVQEFVAKAEKEMLQQQQVEEQSAQVAAAPQAGASGQPTSVPPAGNSQQPTNTGILAMPQGTGGVNRERPAVA